MTWSFPGALFFSAGGYHHRVGANTWNAGAPPAGEDEPRLLDWTLALPAPATVEEAAASLERAGFAGTLQPEGIGFTAPDGVRVLLTVEGDGSAAMG
jgi:catechol 2,3-dioxygenase